MDIRKKQQDDGKNYMMRSFIRCDPHQYYWGNETEDEMQGHVHSIHRELRNAYKFLSKNLNRRDQPETLVMEAICSFETFIPTYETIWHHNLEGYNMHCGKFNDLCSSPNITGMQIKGDKMRICSMDES